MITEEIIKKAQDGDSEAFASIYNETVKTAYYVAKRILISEDATEDVLQEAYIAVYQHLSDYKSGNFQGWVDTIVANRAKNYLRKKNPILFSEMESEERPVVEFEEEKIEFRPDAKVDYNETQRLILEIIDNLSPEQRLSVMLFYFENKSVKEIAEICECSENTVKSRLNYARKKIKEDVLELEKKGTKLYGISIMPFIMWMLTEKAKAAEVPGELAAKVLASTGATAGSVAGGTAVGATTGATASSVVGTGAAVATKVGMAIGAKIAIGVTVVAITVGAVVAGIVIKNNDDPKDNDKITSESKNKDEDSMVDDNSEADIGDAKEEEKKEEKVIKTKLKSYGDYRELYNYNENGKELEYVKTHESTGDVVEHTECVYDDAGTLIKKINHKYANLTEEYFYDKYGNCILTKREFDNGYIETLEIDYDEARKATVSYKTKSGRVDYMSEYSYYESGMVKQEIYRADYVSKCIMDFDENGNLTKYVTYSDDGEVSAIGERTYDEYGNSLSEKHYDGNGMCYLERSYIYEYDENNNIIKENKKEIDHYSDNKEGYVTESTYSYTYHE